MALTNCTISGNGTFTKTGNYPVGYTTHVFTITPNSGYTVTASNFANNTAYNTAIYSITLADSGTPGTASNTVTATVVLNSSYMMPSADTTITIDIDGAADALGYTIAGTYDVLVGSNITPTFSTGTAYNDSGAFGVQETLFTKTLTAGSGYCFESTNIPFHILYATNSSDYDITTGSLTYDSNNNLTAITFTVKYTYPASNVSGDKIEFHAKAVAVPTYAEGKVIKRVVNLGTMDSSQQSREYTVYGDPGADWSLDVYSDLAVGLYGTGGYTGATNIYSLTGQTIPASGNTVVTIPFPETTTNETHVLTLSGDLEASLPNYFDKKVDVIEQIAEVTATFTLTTASEAVDYAGTGTDPAASLASGTNSNVLGGIYNHSPLTSTFLNKAGTTSTSWTLTSKSGAFKIWVIRYPKITDFSNLSASDWSISIEKADFTIDESQDGGGTFRVVYTGNINTFGTANITPTLELDGWLGVQNVAAAPGLDQVTATEYTIAQTGYATINQAISDTATFADANTDTVYATTNEDMFIWKFWTANDASGSEYTTSSTSGYYFKVKQGAWDSTYPEFVVKYTNAEEITEHTNI